MPNSVPEYVFPGWRFVFNYKTDTVETHMRRPTADGGETWEITHATSRVNFLNGVKEYARCVAEIEAWMARDVIAQMPVGRARPARKKRIAGSEV